MKTLIVGAGVVGITTAYYLKADGHEVTVLEREKSAGLETSFANAGLIATGHAFAWGNPSIIKKLITPKSNAHSAFKFQWSWDLQFLKWGMKFIANCTSSKFYKNTLAKQTLCQYSHQLLKYILKKGVFLYIKRDPLETLVSWYKYAKSGGTITFSGSNLRLQNTKLNDFCNGIT